MSVVNPSPAEIAHTVRNDALFRRAWCDRTLPPDLVTAVCTGDLERLLHESRPLQIKDRCLVSLYERGSVPLLIKRHTWGDWHRTIRMAFRESAAHRCARVGTYLHNLGVQTPRPRAGVDLQVGPWVYRSFLITDYIPGESLYRFIRFESHDHDLIRHIARQVAQIWQQLVTMGISHNDFKSENFIVTDDRRVWLIDLEKVHLQENPDRQKQRQLFDVRNLLHIRNWHCRAEDRAIFAEEFLRTASGSWFRSSDIERIARGGQLNDTECEAGLSVVVVCSRSVDAKLAQPCIDSVRDIADEVVLVSPDDSARLRVLERIDFTSQAGARTFELPEESERLSALTRQPWVLILHPHERVTPVLSKDLQQRITRIDGASAYTAEVETLFCGHSLARNRKNPPVRLFQGSECSFSVADNAVRLSSTNGSIPQLAGTIQATKYSTIADMVAALNEQTSRSARERYETGEPAKFFSSAVRNFAEFLTTSIRGGIHGGWSAIQAAAVESTFAWLEEAKLYQLEHRLGCQEPHAAEIASSIPDSHSSQRSDSPLSRAA